MANNNFPQALFEVYMILLFEIARRLVELEEPSEKKVQYDVLPIGSAIARIVKLLELGIKDTCTFKDVFFPKSKFHCFTGKPEERRKAIDKINETTLDITYGASVLVLVPAAKDPAKVFATQVKCHLEELKEMFCSEKQPEAMQRKEDSAEAILQNDLEDLSISVIFTLNHFPENSTEYDREVDSSSHLYLMPIGFSVSELYLDGRVWLHEHGNTGVFDCQVKVCKKFLQQLYEVEDLRPLQNHDIPKKAKTFKPMYDITGFDAFKVVALLCRIVNDTKQFTTGKTFYLLIRNGQESGEIKELFQLEALPSVDQPGNGKVYRLPKGSASFAGGKSYNQLYPILTEFYKEDTESFALHIRSLFQSNTVVTHGSPATIEVYMLLLFEIARRLVNEKNPERKEKEVG
ncbi:unnamed protein product [Porites lobata]|uniref:Uncharacterized protein n=1 Tax=Porites lobata TaxID=104759 RepID=A0ABN8RYN4_9CNID|nr:unnamed protein product [Porites lobata]